MFFSFLIDPKDFFSGLDLYFAQPERTSNPQRHCTPQIKRIKNMTLILLQS